MSKTSNSALPYSEILTRVMVSRCRRRMTDAFGGQITGREAARRAGREGRRPFSAEDGDEWNPSLRLRKQMDEAQ